MRHSRKKSRIGSSYLKFRSDHRNMYQSASPLKREKMRKNQRNYCFKKEDKCRYETSPKLNIFCFTQFISSIKYWFNLIKIISNNNNNTHN